MNYFKCVYMNKNLIKIEREGERSRPHSEAKSGGNGNGVVEDISDVRDVEASLEFLFKLGFPLWITEINGGAVLGWLGRHPDLLGESGGWIRSLKTGVQVGGEGESIVRRWWRRREVVAGKREFGSDRVRQSAHQNSGDH